MSSQVETVSNGKIKRNLIRLGFDPNKFDYIVALAGNPNTGKSTVFNQLTGLRQHTGNWPGKTTTRAEGSYSYSGKRFKLIDLPGTYSLLANSNDEEIARDFLLFGNPDAVVIVVDANALERNLNLVLQIMQITNKIVICLNLMDEAERNGIKIDVKKLEEELGLPVIPTVAREGKGLEELISAIEKVASKDVHAAKDKMIFDAEVDTAVNELVGLLEQVTPNITQKRWLAFRLLSGDKSVEHLIQEGSNKDMINESLGEVLA